MKTNQIRYNIMKIEHRVQFIHDFPFISKLLHFSIVDCEKQFTKAQTQLLDLSRFSWPSNTVRFDKLEQIWWEYKIVKENSFHTVASRLMIRFSVNTFTKFFSIRDVIAIISIEKMVDKDICFDRIIQLEYLTVDFEQFL